MTTLEAHECITVLCELFPQADLQDAEMKLFRDELTKFDRDDAINAIREHRLTARFQRPEFPKIFGMIRERMRAKPSYVASRGAKRFTSVVSEGVAAANPQYAHEPEPVLVLMYHRHWWKVYCTTSAPKSRGIMPEADYKLYTEACQQRTSDHYTAAVYAAVVDLQTVGMSADDAQTYAQELNCADASEFRPVVDSLRQFCSSVAVPEYV